jgi:sugar lactone lactonase YvrE
MMAASTASVRRDSIKLITRAVALALAAIMTIGVAGCGSSGTSEPSASGESTLWVANWFGYYLSAFGLSELKFSGSPDPAAMNQSASIEQPEGVRFDNHENLWVTNCFDSANGVGTVQEYTREQLADLQHRPAPTPAITLLDDGFGDIFDCPYGAQFDSAENLWVSNRFNANLIQFTHDQLKVGGQQFPTTEIDSSAFFQPEDIRFDSAGTLWVADIAEGQVDGFKATTLASIQGTTSTIAPDIVNASNDLASPSALAFDRKGNQWVANCIGDSLVRFAASDLTSSGSPSAIVIISATSVTVPSGTTLSLDCPGGLAFDKHGNLWVSNYSGADGGSLAKFTPSQLTSSGSPAPAVFIDANSSGTNLNQPKLITFGPAPE